MSTTSLTPQQIQHLDQAAVDALSDVDQLAADPETTRRLTERGEAVYGFELTRDLYANGLNAWSLAAWAAFATIRLNQANRRADALLDELTSVREQLATANRRADGLDADLRSAQRGLTAYANQTGQQHLVNVDLDAIQQRANAATPGPWATDPDSAWRRCHEAHEYVYATDPTDRHGVVALTGIKGDHVRNARDAAFIAHARTDVVVLIKEVRRLAAELARNEREHGDTIDDRDRAQQMAADLADGIAKLTGVEIGEHSSMNDPWQNALQAVTEAAEQRDSSKATAPPVRHVLIVTEPGAWTLRHPPGCPLDCPMFALMHTALEHTDMPVGHYEVQPNGLWDRALIGDRIDTAGAAR